MIMLTVTKPRRKLRRILKGAGLLLLLLAVVPGLYYSLNSAGAMSMFASGTMQENGAENGAANGAENGQPAGEQQPAAAEQGDIDDKLGEQPAEQPSDQSNTESNTELNDVQSEEVESDNAQLDDVEANGVQSDDEQPIAEQPEANGDKPGLGQRLRELIFGKEPEVLIYQNEN